jgi:hypothetical protein
MSCGPTAPQFPAGKPVRQGVARSNPRARTGSYFGVYQLSHGEFRKYGGRGIFLT